MNEIIAKLAEIKQELDAIDLAKVKPEETGEKVEKAIKGMDAASKMDGFNTERLDEAIESFKGTSERLEQYDFTPEYEKMFKENDVDKRKDMKAKIDVKKQAISTVKGKYDELTRRKAVIERYEKEFKPEDLVKRQEQKRTRNERRMEDNQRQQDKIINFRDQVVNEELDSIKKNLRLVKALEILKKQREAIKTAQERYDEAKNDSNPDQGYIDHCKAALDQAKSNFDKTLGAIPNVKIDVNNFDASVQEAEGQLKEKIHNAKISVSIKLEERENAGQKEDFKVLRRRIDSAKTNEEFVQAFDEAVAELRSANLNLDRENDNINQNIDILEKGKLDKSSTIQNGSTGATQPISNKQPTDIEIEDMMKNDPDCQQMIADLNLPVDPKTMRKEVYKSLTEGKRGPHLISWIKSFGKKTQNAWMDSKLEDVRKEAIRKVNEVKQAGKEVVGKRKQFVDSLVSHVMSADKDELKEMEEAKGPGKVLNDIYNEMEKNDSER